MIPEAAVEAAWSAFYAEKGSMEAALEAAAPHMLAEGFARAYAAGFRAAEDGSNYDAIGSSPYRSKA